MHRQIKRKMCANNIEELMQKMKIRNLTKLKKIDLREDRKTNQAQYFVEKDTIVSQLEVFEYDSIEQVAFILG